MVEKFWSDWLVELCKIMMVCFVLRLWLKSLWLMLE